MLVGDIVAQNGRRTPDKPAFAYRDSTVTWGELDRITNQVGRALTRLCQSASRPHLAFVADNSLEVIEVCFSAAKAGLALVLVKPAFHPSELARLIDHGDVGVLIVDSTNRERVEEAVALLEEGQQGRLVVGIGEGHGAVADLMAVAATESPAPLSTPQDDSATFAIAYTSGTTGDPKGALVTHRNVTAGAHASALEARVRPHDRALFWNPLFTMGGLGVLLVASLRGCSTWVLDYQVQNDPADGPPVLFESIERNAITFVMGGPTFFFADERTREHDLSSLESVVNGNGSVGRSGRLLAALSWLPSGSVMNLYGMTESSGSMITALQREHLKPRGAEEDRRRALSVGRAAVGIELRIVDEGGTDVPMGSDVIGEVWLRGDAVVSEYWRNEDAQAKAFIDGWFRTGDLARLDTDGNLYLVDRSKDLIRSGSANIYSFEVETVLSDHPSVAEVAVVGVPHDFFGETPKAIVRLRDGGAANEDELIAFVKQRLASYKKPTSVEFVDEFPRNPSGKILKRALRAQYWERPD